MHSAEFTSLQFYNYVTFVTMLQNHLFKQYIYIYIYIYISLSCIINVSSLEKSTKLLRTKVACLWIYKLNWVLTNFSYKLLWTTMETLWTVVITQPQSIVVQKHFTVTIIKLLNVKSRIPIIHLLSIYYCTNSWNIRAAICLQGCLSLLALSGVYSLTVEDGSWSIPMVPAQLSVPLQQVEE